MGDTEPQQSLHGERWELLTRGGGSAHVPRLRLSQRPLDTAHTRSPGEQRHLLPLSHPSTQGTCLCLQLWGGT